MKAFDGRPTVIFDIDGTLANTAHRVKFVDFPEEEKHKRDWKSFFAAQPDDTVIEPMANLAMLYWWSDFNVTLLTGRDEEHRKVTENWLERNSIFYGDLLMRPAGNREDDTTLKVKMLEEHMTEDQRRSIQTIFEDRGRVVKGLRDAGYHVCQVAEGNF